MSPQEQRDLTRVRNDVDSIDEMLADIHSTQAEHTARLGGIDGRLDGIDGRLDCMGGQLGSLEVNVAEILRRLPG